MISEHTLTLAQQLGRATGQLMILRIELNSMLTYSRLSSEVKYEIKKMIEKIDENLIELRK